MTNADCEKCYDRMSIADVFATFDEQLCISTRSEADSNTQSETRDDGDETTIPSFTRREPEGERKRLKQERRATKAALQQKCVKSTATGCR